MDVTDYLCESDGAVSCHCDNCFYGRTKLANEILWLQDALRITADSLRTYGKHPIIEKMNNNLLPEINNG